MWAKVGQARCGVYVCYFGILLMELSISDGKKDGEEVGGREIYRPDGYSIRRGYEATSEEH